MTRLETRDRDSGELLTTRWTSWIYRDVELGGEPSTITIRHEPAASGSVRLEVRRAAGALAISQGVAWL